MVVVLNQASRPQGTLPAQQVTWAWVQQNVDADARPNDDFKVTCLIPNARATDSATTIQYVLRDAVTLETISARSWKGGETDRAGNPIQPVFHISREAGLPSVMEVVLTLSRSMQLGVDVTVERIAGLRAPQ